MLGQTENVIPMMMMMMRRLNGLASNGENINIISTSFSDKYDDVNNFKKLGHVMMDVSIQAQETVIEMNNAETKNHHQHNKANSCL